MNTFPKNDFPRPKSFVALYLSNDQSLLKKKFIRWKRLNKYFVIPFYKLGFLPLVGFSKNFLLLFTIGRKTGKKRIFPVRYVRMDNILHLYAGGGMKADWVKNMLASPKKVKVQIGWRKLSVIPEIIEDSTEKDVVFRKYVRFHPNHAQSIIGWDQATDELDSADFSRVINHITIIRLYKISDDQNK